VMDMSVFGGIILGLLTGAIYNKTRDKQFKGYVTQIFSGVRWSFTIMVLVAILMGVASCYVWPPVQGVIDRLTGLIKEAGNFGLFLYGFLERFLIPTGLHHLVYTPFQFSALGNSLTLGDTTYAGSYIVMMIELQAGLPFSEGIVWMYTGFTKTFGYFGIAAAFIFCANKENRAKTAAMLIPLALTASLASITEPIDFLFCFAAPVLWVVHACIAGLFIVLLNVFNVTGFTTNLLGSVLMNLTAGAERTNYPMLYLLAFVEIVVYFAVFTFLIKKFNLKTPGRVVEADEVEKKTEKSEKKNTLAEKRGLNLTREQLENIIEGLGGRENINTVDNCFTRLRVNVKDASLVKEDVINKTPNSGIVKKNTDIQVVFGLQVIEIKKAVEELL
ncbi:MAG: PTS transporter subunit EIIC, partial [Lachnospiraceae bacterium]|nr:PTS transporter subunit EIIC [Lachnospiraceae bacterium]